MDPCPGLYCGRSEASGGSCSSCPWSSRRNLSHWCVECEAEPPLYDWLYLGFMALLSLMFQGLILDLSHRQHCYHPRDLLILHTCAVFESCVAGLASLLSYRPVGRLGLVGCGVAEVRDWYPLFFNPKRRFVSTVHCAQEVVYPLSTLPMVFYAYSVLALVIVRTAAARVCGAGRRGVSRPVCAALLLFPALLAAQAILGGVLYYSYPYILLVLVLVSNVWHLAAQTDEDEYHVVRLLAANVRDPKKLSVVIGHWLLLAYAIISLTQLRQPPRDLALLCLVPVPAVFYILTARFTAPQ